MLRRSALACAVLVLLLGTAGDAQTSPPVTAPTAAPAVPTRPVAKKAAAKPKTAAKPPAAADNGPCRIGVITAAGDIFTVQKIGLTVFGNDLAEVPVKWGLDDLIFDRVKAAAAPAQVRRISYGKDAFEPYYHPKSTLFRNPQRELATLVKQIAGNAGCERYMVITRAKANADGTNQALEGIGVISWGPFNRIYVFAYLSAVVFDGGTFEARRDPHLTLEAGLARLTAGRSEYLRQLENFNFPESAPDAANDAVLRDAARKFAAERLDKYLPAYFK
jgi:hypothetical protein